VRQDIKLFIITYVETVAERCRLAAEAVAACLSGGGRDGFAKRESRKRDLAFWYGHATTLPE
jgi:hypothetical protein